MFSLENVTIHGKLMLSDLLGEGRTEKKTKSEENERSKKYGVLGSLESISKTGRCLVFCHGNCSFRWN